jgi:hypothetical protein
MDAVAGVAARARGANAAAAARRLRLTWTSVSIGVACAVAAVAGTIGPDARWLAALGRTIVARGAIPDGIPFAAASSHGWPNVPVLAELTFHALAASAGDRGLLVAQLAAVIAAFTLLARDARGAGARDAPVAAALALVVPGALLSLAGIKAQLFSLALFPLLVGLLRAEQRRPSRRIWLLVPLLALWSNLHGAALIGLAIVAVHLVLERARRTGGEAVAVGLASTLALCVTPALWRTPAYYLGVAGSEPARQGYGLWAPLSLHSGFDVLLLGAGALLLAGFVRSRPPVWELAVAAALAALSVHAARNGIWLLVFAAPRAASLPRLGSNPRPQLALALLAPLLAASVYGLARGPLAVGASPALVRRAIARAHGSPILADAAIAEQIAAAGGRVWISNPLDAFGRRDQRLYLDWLRGSATNEAIPSQVRVVVVSRASRAARLTAHDPGFRAAAADERARAFIRIRRAP